MIWYRDPRAVCTVCGQAREDCERVPADLSGHWFESEADNRRHMKGGRARGHLRVVPTSTSVDGGGADAGSY